MKIPADHIEKGLTLTIESTKESYTCLFKDDAIENGESFYQIGEGQFYQYEFSNKQYGFHSTEIIEPFKNNKHLGRIAPNIYVGTLPLEVYNLNTGEPVGAIDIEVQSQKASYRNDYRTMLEEITEHCLDLILQINVPVRQNLSIDFGKDSRTDYQRFAFINSIVNSDGFYEAVQRIISAPTTTWTSEIQTVDLRKIKRIDKKGSRQIVTGTNRFNLPKNHELRNHGINSIPLRIESTIHSDSVDTPENRFVKHALEVFLQFVMEFERSAQPKSRESKEAKALVGILEEHLSHNLFKSISRPSTLNLNSPILQRKEGYREVLRTWILFDLAAKLIWHGGEDVYHAGKRDIATLYEYWLFFKLLKLLSNIFKVDAKDLSELIKPTADGLGLQLKQGKHTALKGIFRSGTRALNIQFSYNRSFSGANDYPRKGSWTKSMRPDYTLSIWPYGIDESEAEISELIAHVHFDAKYKIENFLELVGNDNLDDEKLEQAKGKYKNADLLKMHAYRDAIRRTAGAYVLYPGDQNYRRVGFHEIIPGLGAFSIKPSKNDSGIVELKSFILEIIDHFTNRASQREQTNLKNYLIHQEKPSDSIHEALPENYGFNRELHPNETSVIIGYYKSVDHLNWILKTKLYNARINSGRGSIRIQKEIAGAKYLLLHGSGEIQSNKLFGIDGEGPRLFTSTELKKIGYPNPGEEVYLVFKLQLVNLDDFGNSSWDFRMLAGYKSKRGSTLPFVVSLSELLKAKTNPD